MKRTRLGVIGLGMASAPHARSLADLADRVEVAAVYSPSAERRSAFADRARRPGRRQPGGGARRPGDRCGDAAHAAQQPSGAGPPGGSRRQAHPARKAAGDQPVARRGAGRDGRGGRGDAGGGAAAPVPSGGRGAGGGGPRWAAGNAGRRLGAAGRRRPAKFLASFRRTMVRCCHEKSPTRDRSSETGRFVLGRAMGEKISAVEGLRLSKRMSALLTEADPRR